MSGGWGWPAGRSRVRVSWGRVKERIRREYVFCETETGGIRGSIYLNVGIGLQGYNSYFCGNFRTD